MYVNNYTHENQFRQTLFSNYNENIRLVINYLLNFSYSHKDIFVSQDTIAKNLCLSKKTVYRIIKKLKELNFIKVAHRFKSSNITILNPYFFSRCRSLATYFPCLKRWSQRTFTYILETFGHLYKRCIFNNNLNRYNKFKNYKKSMKPFEKVNSKITQGINSIGNLMSGFMEQAKGSLKKVSHSYKPKKEEVMMVKPEKLKGSEVFHEMVDMFNMNEYQSANFYCIPDEAKIYFMDTMRARGKYVISDFKSAFDWIVDYCRKNQLEIDWEMHKLVKMRYGSIPEQEHKKEEPLKTAVHKNVVNKAFFLELAKCAPDHVKSYAESLFNS